VCSIMNKTRLRHWTLKRPQVMFDEKRRESLRRFTLKQSQVIFDKKKLVMSWFYFGLILLTFNLILKIIYGTNDRLKLTLKKKSD